MCESHRALGVAHEQTRRRRTQRGKGRHSLTGPRASRNPEVIERKRVAAPTPAPKKEPLVMPAISQELKALVERLISEEGELPAGKVYRRERVQWRGSAMDALREASNLALPQGRNGRFLAHELIEARTLIKKRASELGIELNLPSFIEDAE